MRTSSIFGIVLILLGVAGLLWGGIEFTTDDQVADIGPVEVETERTERIAGAAAGIAEILFYVFLALLVISAVASALRGRPPV